MAPPAASATNLQQDPPTYSVEEDDDGKLVSWKYQVTWPNRPETGRYALNADVELSVRKRRQQQNESTKGARADRRFFDNRLSVSEDEDEPVVTTIQMMVGTDSAPTEFLVRALRTESVNKHFNRYQRRSLVIYYRLPYLSGPFRTISAIPLHVPLMIAYSAAESGVPSPDSVVHAEVQCFSRQNDNNEVEYLWCALQLDSDGEPRKFGGGTLANHRPGFPTLRLLLEYYVSMSVRMADSE